MRGPPGPYLRRRSGTDASAILHRRSRPSLRWRRKVVRVRAYLVTNDDGIDSPGILALVEALCAEHSVTVVAPAGDRSGVSHAITADASDHDRAPRRLESSGLRVLGNPRRLRFLGHNGARRASANSSSAASTTDRISPTTSTTPGRSPEPLKRVCWGFPRSRSRSQPITKNRSHAVTGAAARSSRTVASNGWPRRERTRAATGTSTFPTSRSKRSKALSLRA